MEQVVGPSSGDRDCGSVRAEVFRGGPVDGRRVGYRRHGTVITRSIVGRAIAARASGKSPCKPSVRDDRAYGISV
jgi:hypothetical protein